MTSYPTGEQVELTHGDQLAVVVQVGAGLRAYDVGGRAVVDGYGPADIPDGGRGQVLAPWPNRIRDGRYRWDGADRQLPLTEADKHNAIHGLVRWMAWSVAQRSRSAATLTTRVWPQPGYPFLLDLETRYALADDGLSVTVTGRNAGDVPLPYGAGQHPYVTAGTELVDDAVLTLPADSWLSCDERGLPVSTEDVAGTDYDFRSRRRIGATVLDHPFAGLHRDELGRVVVRLERADGSHGVDVWHGDGVEALQVFSGDTLATERRRRGLAVEPMSCPPDAFNSGTGLVVLAPGDAHALGWGLRAW